MQPAETFEADDIVVETATRICEDLAQPEAVNAAEAGEWPAPLWDALEEAGLTLAWVSEARGGADAGMANAFAVLRVAGRNATPVPLAETLLAGWLLERAGIDVPAGPLSLAPLADPGAITEAGRKLQGTAHAVPFGRWAEHIAVLLDGDAAARVALVKRADCTVDESHNMAGEPSDAITFDGAAPIAIADLGNLPGRSALELMGAAARAQQMVGALERILQQSVAYAQERQQFGRPIGKFQAVQHNLAQLAAETAAAGVAADAAARAIGLGGVDSPGAALDVATAKVRVGEAANLGASIAHQVHGAMGYTYEHSLHHATRRLWSWRDDFGAEAVWATRLGRLLAAKGADGIWPALTGG